MKAVLRQRQYRARIKKLVSEARAELLENVKKLRRRSLKGDKAVKVQQLAHAQGLGDTDAEDELLRELSRVAQEKRRLN